MSSPVQRPEKSIERCHLCDEPTGKAGVGDGSLYDGAGVGPYCERCFPDRLDELHDRLVTDVRRLVQEVTNAKKERNTESRAAKRARAKTREMIGRLGGYESAFDDQHAEIERLRKQVDVGLEALAHLTDIDHGPEEAWHRWLNKRDRIVDHAREAGLLKKEEDERAK